MKTNTVFYNLLGCPRKLVDNLTKVGILGLYNPFPNHLLSSWDIQVVEVQSCEWRSDGGF